MAIDSLTAAEGKPPESLTLDKEDYRELTKEMLAFTKGNLSLDPLTINDVTILPEADAVESVECRIRLKQAAAENGG